MAVWILEEAIENSQAINTKIDKRLARIPYKTTRRNITRRNNLYNMYTVEDVRIMQMNEAIRILKENA